MFKFGFLTDLVKPEDLEVLNSEPNFCRTLRRVIPSLRPTSAPTVSSDYDPPTDSPAAELCAR